MKSPDREETMNKLQSTQREKNAESNNKDRDVYFIILRPSEEKIDFKNLKFISKISPTIIFNKNIEKEKGSFLEEFVFKFKKKNKKKKKKQKKKKLREKRNIR